MVRAFIWTELGSILAQGVAGKSRPSRISGLSAGGQMRNDSTLVIEGLRVASTFLLNL